jgi:hypothetical protein
MKYNHKMSLQSVQYNQHNNTRPENSDECSDASFGSEIAQCATTEKVYKVGSNSSLETIRLG